MNQFRKLAEQTVTVELSGNKSFEGTVVEIGSDILVLYCNEMFYYIPMGHVQYVTLSKTADTRTGQSSDNSEPKKEQALPSIEDGSKVLTFRKVLTEARGHFLELYVSGNTILHGYLTSIMNDYFVFHSPVYHTVYITLQHLKWLIPYPQDTIPYSLPTEAITFHPASLPTLRSFQEQCKKLEGNLVVFDFGDKPNKIGLLRNVDTTRRLAELVTADGRTVFWNLHHLKSVYRPGKDGTKS